MKTYQFIISLLAFFMCIACKKEEEPEIPVPEPIVIAEGWIQSPQWLVQTVDSVAHRYDPSRITKEYPYPEVYSVQHDGTDYTLVRNLLASDGGRDYFTAFGVPVDPLTALYVELESAADRTFLWRRSDVENDVFVVNGQIKTPAWLVSAVDSVAHLYDPYPGTGEYLPPWVYVVRHGGEQYIAVTEAYIIKYTFPHHRHYFTLSGVPVEQQTISPSDAQSGLYGSLELEEDRTLLWREPETTDEIIIVDGWLQSPKWLVYAINNLIYKLTPSYSIWRIKVYESDEYISVSYIPSSGSGTIYFTLSGQLFNPTNFPGSTLLWEKSRF